MNCQGEAKWNKRAMEEINNRMLSSYLFRNL